MDNSLIRAQKRIKVWRENPCQFVADNFAVTLDAWQEEALKASVSSTRVCLKACTGPGKTAVLAWLGWWRLSCFGSRGEHPKGAALSVNRDNLTDNLWPELSKWQQRSEYLKTAFTPGKEHIRAKDHPDTWFLSARGYARDADTEAIGRSLSGLHSAYPFVLLDESGDMPAAVGRAADQIFTGSPVSALIVQGGNPTSTNGLLYQSCVTHRHQWAVITVTADPDDPNRTPRVSIEHAREQIATHGRDNPWLMATILGLFPAQGFNSLLGIDEVERAMNIHPAADSYDWAAKILGVDVARFGDDRTVIFPRQGLVAMRPTILRGMRTTDIAAKVATIKAEWGGDAMFIDDTGHWGHGVIDNLISAGGYNPVGIQFHGQPIDPRYKNKRAEMWFMMADWVKGGGSLPPIPELIPELTTPTYTISNGKILLEDKDQIKKRLGRSPDCFVAGTLVLTTKGNIPIESVAVGDRVITPVGLRTVLRVWETNADRLTMVTMSNGKSLIGKGKHKILTTCNGWCSMDAVPLNNGIETLTIKRGIQWLIVKTLCTRGINIGFKAQVDTFKMETKHHPKDFYTGGYGSTITALFRQAWQYITGTVIGETTALRTLSLSHSGNMPSYTCLIGGGVPNTESKLCNHCETRTSLRNTGIQAQREKDGIVFMASKHGKRDKQPMSCALFVGRNTEPISPQGQGFAPISANKKKDMSELKPLLANVRNVVKALFTTNIGFRPVVPVSVLTVDVEDSVKTYNLTLDADNVYYANGVLVDNCADALALTFAFPVAPRNRLTNGYNDSNRNVTDYDPLA